MEVSKRTSFFMSVLLFISSIALWPWLIAPAPAPRGLSEYTEKPAEIVEGDFYVSQTAATRATAL